MNLSLRRTLVRSYCLSSRSKFTTNTNHSIIQQTHTKSFAVEDSTLTPPGRTLFQKVVMTFVQWRIELPDVQVSDTTNDDSSNAAGDIIINI